jgi:hypothetical protein
MPFDVQGFLDSLGWQVWAAVSAASLAACLVVLTRLALTARRRTGLAAVPIHDFALAFDLAPPVQRADPFAHGTAGQQIERARSRPSVVGVVLFDAKAKGDPAPAIVLDQSVTGMRLGVDQPVRSGTILTVKPACAPQGALGVRVEVRNCRPEGKGWELGCRFVKSP